MWRYCHATGITTYRLAWPQEAEGELRTLPSFHSFILQPGLHDVVLHKQFFKNIFYPSWLGRFFYFCERIWKERRKGRRKKGKGLRWSLLISSCRSWRRSRVLPSTWLPPPCEDLMRGPCLLSPVLLFNFYIYG